MTFERPFLFLPSVTIFIFKNATFLNARHHDLAQIINTNSEYPPGIGIMPHKVSGYFRDQHDEQLMLE